MRVIAVLALVVLPLAAVAQTPEADRGYLQGLLEDNLSGAGRQVTITGFEGALSSTAKIARLTIADDQGIWLTLNDVVLDWNRAALLTGAVQVNTLTAAEIDLERLPQGQSGATAEAGTFSLPELPVSVDIGKLAAKRIVLGPSVLGEPIEASLDAALTLAGGEGKARLDLQRTDSGPAGRIALQAGYGNASKLLTVDLAMTEAAGGLISGKLGLPGAPSVGLTVKGQGPIAGFLADIDLKTDDVTRLAGQVTLTGADTGATRFTANLGGDVVPLFLPEYAAFFGPDVRLIAAGKKDADGSTDLEAVSLTAQAVKMGGSLHLASSGMPESFDLTLALGLPDGSPVLLPVSAQNPVRITSAGLKLGYDAAKGEGWVLNGAVNGLQRDDLTIAGMTLAGSGRISQRLGKPGFGATLNFAAGGIAPRDPALAQALGQRIAGKALFYWTKGDSVVTLPKLTVEGADYSADLSARFAGLSTGLEVSGSAKANLANLSRLSGLAGRALSGSARLKLAGTAVPLTGAFDATVTAKGNDMAVGVAQLDRMLRGEAVVDASVRRDTDGISLRLLDITASTLKASAAGRLSSSNSDITANLDFSDLSVLGDGFRGELKGAAHLTGPIGGNRLTIEAQGTDLAVGQPEADKLLRGASSVKADLTLANGRIRINDANLDNPQLSAQASGQLDGEAQRVQLRARLANLGLVLPDFPGPLTLTGTAVQAADGTTLDLEGKGPGQIDATVKGRIAAGFRSADLAIAGTAQAALANAFISPRSISGPVRFDLRLNGALVASSLGGTASLTGGRLADPGLSFALQGIAAKATLGGGRAVVDMRSEATSGGTITVTGGLGLAAPFAGDLAVGVAGLQLRDPNLFRTTLNGDVTVKGPLTGGAMIAGNIALGRTEVQVPSSGFGGAAGLPDLKHVNEPAAVRTTRERAGLVAKAGGRPANSKPFGLDLAISAPGQLFVRGRGLDAELGGALRIGGTTLAVVPSGAFNLIRGRLDILGKRLDLSQADLLMEGELVPYLHVLATTTNQGVAVSVQIDGPATEPVVSFTSTPSLPQEEVLAQLLFGQSLQGLSAFQAVQLASAVATLAGKGGAGVIDRLRKSTGLDNLDVKTNADGSTALAAGKYLTKKIYTEVQVDQGGKTKIDLNLDVTKSVTLRGSSSSEGVNSLGVYLEKDY